MVGQIDNRKGAYDASVGDFSAAGAAAFQLLSQLDRDKRQSLWARTTMSEALAQSAAAMATSLTRSPTQTAPGPRPDRRSGPLAPRHWRQAGPRCGSHCGCLEQVADRTGGPAAGPCFRHPGYSHQSSVGVDGLAGQGDHPKARGQLAYYDRCAGGSVSADPHTRIHTRSHELTRKSVKFIISGCDARTGHPNSAGRVKDLGPDDLGLAVRRR